MRTFSRRSAISRMYIAIIAIIVIVAAVAGGLYYGGYFGPSPSPSPGPSPSPTPSPFPTPSPSPAAEQTIILGTTESSVDNLDPTYGWSKTTYLISSLCYEALLTFEEPNCTQLRPKLAKSFTISADAMTYDFALREDVYFHDGTHFNATVAQLVLQWVIDKQVPMVAHYKNVATIQALGTYQLRITLKTPNVYFGHILAMPFAANMYPYDTMLALGNQTWGKTVLYGSGPFKFYEYVKGDRCVFVRNEEYWGQKPKLEKIIFKYIGDPTTARMSLEAGEIDMLTWGPLPTDMKALMANPEIEYISRPIGVQRQLYFCEKVSPMENKLVRQAMCYAINVTRVWEIGYMGLGEVSYSLMPTWLKPYYKPSHQMYATNKTRAMELLAEAGYPNGFSTDLYYCTFWSVKDGDVAAVIADELDDVGIQCSIHLEEYAALMEKIRQPVPTLPLILAGYDAANSNPEVAYMGYLNPVYGLSIRNMYWNNSRFTELGYTGRSTLNLTEQIAIYHEAQDIFAEEAVALPLAVTPFVWFWRHWVKDFVMYDSKFIYDVFFRNAYIAVH